MGGHNESIILQPSPRHHSHRIAAERKSRPASLRFSGELDDLLRWEGLSRIENLDINDFQEDDHELGNATGSDLDIEDDVQILPTEEAGDFRDFSELTIMLASAKRKLDVCRED